MATRDIDMLLKSLKGEIIQIDNISNNENSLRHQESLKLYECRVIEDCEFETVLIVAKDEDDAKLQIEEMDWSCFMGVHIFEIKDINGHKIIVQ